MTQTVFDQIQAMPGGASICRMMAASTVKRGSCSIAFHQATASAYSGDALVIDPGSACGWLQ